VNTTSGIAIGTDHFISASRTATVLAVCKQETPLRGT
jgi:hypothetical protein